MGPPGVADQGPTATALAVAEGHPHVGIDWYCTAAPDSLRFVASNEFSLEWPPRSGIVRSFPEIDRAEWFTLADAAHKLVSGQVPILHAPASALQRR